MGHPGLRGCPTARVNGKVKGSGQECPPCAGCPTITNYEQAQEIHSADFRGNLLGLVYYTFVVLTLWTRQAGISEIRNKVEIRPVLHNFLQCWQWFGIMTRI